MYFDSVHAALSMNGHGAFVWSAYGITLLVLAQLLLWPWSRRRRLLRELRGEQRRRARPSPSVPTAPSVLPTAPSVPATSSVPTAPSVPTASPGPAAASDTEAS